jgi:hypothetical protein
LSPIADLGSSGKDDIDEALDVPADPAAEPEIGSLEVALGAGTAETVGAEEESSWARFST